MANDPISIIRQMALLGQNLGQRPPQYADEGGSQITTPTDYLRSTPPPNLNVSGEPPIAQYPQNTDIIQQALAPPTAPEETEIEKQGRMMREQYHPSYTSENRLNELLGRFPQEPKPNLFRTLTAITAGLGRGGIEEGQKIMDEPHSRDLADWKLQVEPAAKAAEIERQGNVNERYIAAQTINSQLAQQKMDELIRKNQAMEEIAQTRANAYAWAKEHPTWKTDFSGTRIISVGPIGPDGKPQMADLGPTSHVDDMTKLRVTGEYKVKAAEVQGANAARVAGIRAATTYNLPDEEGNMVPHVFNPATKSWSPYIDPTTGLSPTGPAQKPGTPNASQDPNALTTQSKNMMQGARMLLPLVTDVGEQAANLEKNGQFGVVMSRVRDLATKVGTTGSPGEVQKSLEEFSTALKDPSFNPGNDFAAGQFLDSLGFLASGAARVHSRTGGSMGMINYFKALLGADSTLNMFNGKLTALQNLLTHYAEGPNAAVIKGKKPVTSNVPANKKEDILDSIFGPAPTVKK